MLNSSLLKALCQMSAIVYKPQTFFTENYKKISLEKGCECLNHIQTEPKLLESDRDCQCYVSKFNKNSILVAFRGSQEMRDWLTDANIIRVNMDLHNVPDNERPKVHWGILRQFRSVEDKITQFIDETLTNDKLCQIENIVYTGHSLGGGLASIALMNYFYKYPELKHMCVTFGAPRVGNKQFRQKFEYNCAFSKRYVNYYDPVPSLPFSLRYSHACPSDHINVNIIDHIETPISRFFWVMFYKFAHLFGSAYNPVNDHSIDNYYSSLCNLLPDDELNVIDANDITMVEEKTE